MSYGFGFNSLRRISFVLAGFVAALILAGCTHVAPYERARLADPNMTALDLDGPAAEHVYAVHEGAAGGGAVAESGCGCN
ncbi:MAG: DUF4266 domain-containing protein [Polyangiaceae bacterium]